MSPTPATPQTWTLRLKHHRTTVLLHADPLQTLSSLRAELLSALRQTNPDGRLHGKPLPDSADQIELAMPRDRFNVGRGWVRVGLRVEGKGKGKGVEGKEGKGKGREKEKGGVEESVKGCGLRDNGVLAFRWRGEEEGEEKVEGREADGEGMEVEDEDDEGWDVVIPSYEDAYGVENEGDVGGWNEFNG